MFTKMIKLNIEINIELIVENKYGKLFKTSEGYHINGNKTAFIRNLKKDLNSDDILAQICANNALYLIKHYPEI
jgi:hypothetical protein